MVFNRAPDRRKTRREDSKDGRRTHKRFILDESIVVKITTSDNKTFCADLLDLSLSGMYIVVVTDHWQPTQNENIKAYFDCGKEQKDVFVTGKIQYSNPGSLLGEEAFGMGIHFDEKIASLLSTDSEGNAYLAGKRLITHK